MRRGVALWLLGFAVACVGAVVAYTACPGCIPRDRVNKTCEWTGDTPFALDAQNAAQQAHLVADAQLAEELGIRNADAEFDRRFGIEHHGGLLENSRFREDCLARMFDAIEKSHGVSPAQIALARGQRNPVFDVAVVLLFLPLYSLGAAMACRWLRRRFPSNERFARLVATGLASLAVAVLGMQAFRLWGGVWEVIRVGNGHMTSIRAASSTGWPHQYPGADFIGGVLLFWLVALICYRTMSDGEEVADLGNPRAILLQ